ncbi:MAG TPA: carboxypeptidase regulatory-like domain-containing protein [Patescibacteria group bacterium]|nr:carboxypeptidase regulatory-like domain-containing protein [Patescibacteria group bacterium]
MRSFSKQALGLIVLIVSAIPLAMGATIGGTVKGPDGAPFEGAFVEAQNTATNISTDVLSQVNGSYTVPNLPAGTYRLTIRAVGYKAAPQSETLETADQNAQADFALEKGTVSWSDLSVWQAQLLLPNGPGREFFLGPRKQPFGDSAGQLGVEGTCFTCHDFQSRMATRRLNHQGWLGLVNFMRFDAVPYFIGTNGVFPFSNPMANQAADYLTQIFGLNSTLPASPADLPGYQATVRRFSNRAMNIVYVTYPTPDQTWLPFQAYPPTVKGFPSDGSIWVANYGNANEVDQIDPTTGKARMYRVPCPSAAGIHSVEVGPDGYVWFAEQGCNRVGRIDVKTGEVKQYQNSYVPGKEWGLMGGSTHDAHPMVVDGKLYVFSSGYPATRLDPATGKFTPVPGTNDTYDVYEDLANGKIWLTNIEKDPLREVDPKTLKTLVSVVPPVDPTTFQSHRIAISPEGVVWVTCREDRICSYDPKTKAFKQYTPLGPETDDYAIGIDNAGKVWWSMSNLDTLQRLDPKTGHIVEYPFPYPEITMRKFWLDTQGRMWTTSPANGVVVYWYLAKGKAQASK